ncbi:hypothetical protein Tco_0732958, partial [Tanacetum coccineum]
VRCFSILYPGDVLSLLRGILAGKVDMELSDGCDKPLRLADMLLNSWDGGLGVCVNLTRSSPLMQTWMTNSVHGVAVNVAT